MWLTLVLNLVKNNWRLFVGLLGLLCILFAFWYTHHQGYLEGKAEVEARDAKIVGELKQDKLNIEAQHEKDTLAIASAYSSQLDYLNDRLQHVQVVSGGGDLCVASEINPASGVPQAAPAAGRTNETFALKPPATLRISIKDALEDTQQCEDLQQWVRDVCTK